jgi:glucose-6-phosphate 1-dehydrogenase
MTPDAMHATDLHQHIQTALDLTQPKSGAYCMPDHSATPVGPCAVVIFGAAGDLTKRKLLPSLYNLAACRLLPDSFAIVGFARTEMDTAAYREKLRQDLAAHATSEVDPALVQHLVERSYYVSGSFEDPEAYERLAEMLRHVDQTHGTLGNYLHYLAIAPNYFAEAARQLYHAGLVRERDAQWRRVIVEKPLGTDFESAQALNAELRKVLTESQTYRIDHYLGKETVQNLLVFRFGNGMFEPTWNRRYIDHVQITVAESLGVEARGGYYDEAGALRDMIPNHMLQLLSLCAMEPPTSFAAEAVREEKAKVLRSIQPLSGERVLTHAVRGQYGPGRVGTETVPGYRQEQRVKERSNTETYAALRLSIDNWRWADVPFYLRTGKRLAARTSEIAIQFRRPPLTLFRDTPVEKLAPNQLIVRIQPEEGISLRFGAKVPGPSVRVGPVAMDFRYRDHFGLTPSTGYETLLYDCMKGDATLFQRADTIEAGWGIVTPVLEVWKALPARNFANYAAGSQGPVEADELLARDGRKWRTIEQP